VAVIGKGANMKNPDDGELNRLPNHVLIIVVGLSFWFKFRMVQGSNRPQRELSQRWFLR